MLNLTLPETPQRLGIGPVLVGTDRGPGTEWDDSSHQLLDAAASGQGIGTTVFLLESGTLCLLRRAHRATAAEWCVIESVHVVGGPDQEVQVEGPVLAVFEGTKTVQDQGLVGGFPGTEAFMEEEAVTAEAIHVASDGTRSDAELAADLTQTGTADETMKERNETVGALQPVGGRVGLCTEIPPAMMTKVPLDATGWVSAVEEALFLVAPNT